MSDEPTPEKMIEMVEGSIRMSVGPDGLGLNHCWFWEWEKGGLTMCALDLPPNQLFTYLINTVDSDICDYLIAAIDMSSAPDQGLEFDDFVLVCEFDRSRPAPFLTSQWRYGVINYKKGDDATKIVRAIDWNNATWHNLGAYHMRYLGPPFRAILKRDRTKMAAAAAGEHR